MNPWETEEGKKIWKSPSEYFNWARGALRRAWADYPLRKEWKKGQLRAVSVEEKARKIFHPSTKNVGQCVYCKEWLAGSKLEVDHKQSSDGCKSWEEVAEFLWYCIRKVGDDFVLACKPCHKIKTYAERYEMSFEEARIEKEVIDVFKTDGKAWLLSRGITPAKNSKLRRDQVREVLKNVGSN